MVGSRAGSIFPPKKYISVPPLFLTECPLATTELLFEVPSLRVTFVFAANLRLATTELLFEVHSLRVTCGFRPCVHAALSISLPLSSSLPLSPPSLSLSLSCSAPVLEECHGGLVHGIIVFRSTALQCNISMTIEVNVQCHATFFEKRIVIRPQ